MTTPAKTTVALDATTADGVDDATPQAWRPGPLGRLGAWAATHFRVTLVAWLLIAAGLAMFAPKAQHVLSGAGWEVSGSESVAVRQLVQQEFGGEQLGADGGRAHRPRADR